MSRSRIAFAARRGNTSIPVWPTTRTAGDSSLCRPPVVAVRWPRQCPAKARPRSPHTRFVLRPIDQHLFDEVQAQMNEPEFGKKVAERMWKCEGLFAEAKQLHGLAPHKYRGRSKVQIQAYLCGSAEPQALLFPLYCWLLAHRWSYSTNNATALPSHQSRPSTNC